MSTLQCIIVDDEPSAQELLREYIENTPRLELIDICNNALEALELLRERAVDLCFLDIHMPTLSGIDFMKSLNNPPAVIITTAYDEYALEGYELDVIDYLLKPFSFERFVKAVNKAADRLQNGESAEAGYITVKADRKLYKINLDQLSYIESVGDYVTIHYNGNRITAYDTLKHMEEILPDDRFVRVHKSYIVSLDRIDYLEGNQLILKDEAIPIGATYKEELLKLFSG